MLKGAEATIFLNNYSEDGNKCFISKVTYLEVLKNFEKQLRLKVGKIENQLNSIKRQTGSIGIEIPEEFIREEVKKYRIFFDVKLKLHKITISPIPKISHIEILKYTIQEKAPFNHSDEGYKDFLIFHGILENIEKYQKDVILISNDNDFGERDVHSDLKELNNSKNHISLRKSLNEINQNELKNSIALGNAKLNFITELFEDSSHSSEYLNSVIDYINEQFPEIKPTHLDDYSDLIMDEPSLDEFEFFENSGDIISINAISSDLIVVKAKFEAHISYSFIIDPSNLYLFRDLPDGFEMSYDINEENNAFVWLAGNLSIKAQIQSDKNGLDIRNVELTITDGNYPGP